MEKTAKASASVVKTQLGRFLNEAQFGGKRLIIEKHNQPAAALVPISDYERLIRLSEDSKRQGK